MRGLDQEQFEDRLAWFDRVESNPDVSFDDYLEYADKSYQYKAALLAYEDALAGIPTGHMVGLDAAASGVSIMGVCMGCKVTCANTGLIGSKRMDMYGECTKAMNKLLESNNQYPRKAVKGAQMPYWYGSEAEPRNVFGEGETLQAFHDAQDIVAPGPVWLREELLMSWQPFALDHSWTMPDGFEVIKPVLEKLQAKIEIDELPTESGGHAAIQYVYEANIGVEDGLTIAADSVHSIDGLQWRELNRRCNYNRKQLKETREILQLYLAIEPTEYIAPTKIERLWQDHQFLSLVGIESVLGYGVFMHGKAYCEALLELVNQTLEYPSFEVMCIHDEYKAHPNYVNQMRRVYIEIIAELAESRVMDCIIGQVRNDPNYKIDKLSDDLGDLIRQGEYAIS